MVFIDAEENLDFLGEILKFPRGAYHFEKLLILNRDGSKLFADVLSDKFSPNANSFFENVKKMRHEYLNLCNIFAKVFRPTPSLDSL